MLDAYEFQASLAYIVKPYLKIKRKQKQKNHKKPLKIDRYKTDYHEPAGSF